MLDTGVKADKGQIMILMAGEGSNNEVSESGPLLTVHARAQAVSDTVTTSVYISDFEISKDGVGRTVEGATHAFQITVDTQNVDTVALNAAITQAQGKLDATKEGTTIGTYPVAARTALQAAISSAQATANGSSSQNQVDAAVISLQAALQTYITTFITLIPGETSITLNDLSLISKYYGTRSTDANWPLIEKADIYHRGVIDIQVLAAVAKMILDDWLNQE